MKIFTAFLITFISETTLFNLTHSVDRLTREVFPRSSSSQYNQQMIYNSLPHQTTADSITQFNGSPDNHRRVSRFPIKPLQNSVASKRPTSARFGNAPMQLPSRSVSRTNTIDSLPQIPSRNSPNNDRSASRFPIKPRQTSGALKRPASARFGNSPTQLPSRSVSRTNTIDSIPQIQSRNSPNNYGSAPRFPIQPLHNSGASIRPASARFGNPPTQLPSRSMPRTNTIDSIPQIPSRNSPNNRESSPRFSIQTLHNSGALIRPASARFGNSPSHNDRSASRFPIKPLQTSVTLKRPPSVRFGNTSTQSPNSQPPQMKTLNNTNSKPFPTPRTKKSPNTFNPMRKSPIFVQKIVVKISGKGKVDVKIMGCGSLKDHAKQYVQLIKNVVVQRFQGNLKVSPMAYFSFNES